MQRAIRDLTLFLIVLLPGTHAFAQTTPVEPGARVRVSVAGQPDKLAGSLREQSRDSLVIADSETGILRTVGVDQVTKLEIWRGHSVAKAWGVGTGVGALAGILVGATVDPPCSGGTWCIGPQDQGDMVVAGVVGGAVVGGVIGLVVGAVNRHGWVPLDLAVIRSQGPGTGVGLSWRIALPAVRAP